MAKTRMRSKEVSFERKARLAQRPRHEDEDDFNARLDWMNRMEVEAEAEDAILADITGQNPQ